MIMEMVVGGTCVRFTIITALIVFGWSGEMEYTAPIHPSGTLVVGVLQFLWWIISLVCLIIRAVVANRIPEYVARDRSDALSFGGHGPSSRPVSSANNQSFDFSDTSPRLSPDPESASLPPTGSQRSAAYGSGPAGAHTGSGPTRSGNTSGTLNCPQCNAPEPAYMHLCPACADASGRH